MDPETWKKVEALFVAAAELTGRGRDEFLKRECAGDERLRREVNALLAADADAGAIDDSALETIDFSLLPPNTRVGAFTIREEIGAGGMGVVYRAEREDGEVRQTVAIKVIRAAALGPELERRFRAERQILAQLNHAGIARLIDAGATEDGSPYVAMEFVDGLPLLEHCDAKKLDIRARLQLFTRICDAVQYAHVNLIVHRDLKPSNILVTADGQPKLLDFGIAKLIEPDAEDLTIAAAGERGGHLTLAYASPEHLRGEAVTTAADVYSLGVVLSELLCSGRPYNVASISAERWGRTIEETAPARPSSLAAAAKDAAAVAAARGETSATLAARLRGDLDSLVEKATRREPEQRYPGASDFAADVARYLAGFPVEARKGSRRYRLAKFVRRNAAAVAAALSLAVLAVAFLITLAVYSMRLTAERDRANHQAEQAEAVSRLLMGLLEQSSPEITGRQDVTVREALDFGADLIMRDTAADPTNQLRLFATLVRCYGDLAEYERGFEVADAGLRRHRAALAVDDPAILLLRFRRTELLVGAGRDADALAELNDLLPMWQSGLTADRVDLAELEILLSKVHERLSQFDAAQAAAEQAVSRRDARFGPTAPQTAKALVQLSSVLKENGNQPKADELLRAACKALDSAGEREPLSNCLATLANTLVKEGLAEDSLVIVDKLLANDLEAYGGQHPVYASSLHNGAVIYGSAGQMERAKELCTQALEIRKKTLGMGHARTWSSMQILAQIDVRLGENAAARALMEQVMAAQQASPDASPEQVTNTLSLLGQIEYLSADYATAAQTLSRAVSQMREQGLQGGDYISTLHDLGRTYNFLQRYGVAEMVLAEMLDLAKTQMNEDSHLRVVGQGELGWAIAHRGQFEQGQALLTSAVEHWRHLHGEGRDTNRMQQRLDILRQSARTR